MEAPVRPEGLTVAVPVSSCQVLAVAVSCQVSDRKLLPGPPPPKRRVKPEELVAIAGAERAEGPAGPRDQLSSATAKVTASSSLMLGLDVASSVTSRHEGGPLK
jgi:hypothetical protein